MRAARESEEGRHTSRLRRRVADGRAAGQMPQPERACYNHAAAQSMPRLHATVARPRCSVARRPPACVVGRAAQAPVVPAGRRRPAGHGRRRPHGVRRRHDRRVPASTSSACCSNVVGPQRDLILARLEGGPLANTGVISGHERQPGLHRRPAGRRRVVLARVVSQGTARRHHADRRDDSAPSTRPGRAASAADLALDVAGDAGGGVRGARRGWPSAPRRRSADCPRRPARRRSRVAGRSGAGAAADRRGDGDERLRSGRRSRPAPGAGVGAPARSGAGRGAAADAAPRRCGRAIRSA